MVPLDTGSSLDRYELVERIAVGGMAEVFRAKAQGAHGFEKTLAIKRILPDLAREPEFENRFIAEAKLAVGLTHANIVQVLDFGRFGGSLYIAMEYVDGPDLAALCKALAERGRPMPVAAALHVAMEIAKGLDFAHQRGVVHRDVSPSNILLSRAGEVKIADFGIATAAAESERALSGVRRIMGKWRYMSPEQARGEPVDARSDLFSAAVVMYELFTGKKLFAGDDIEAIVKSVCGAAIPPPSKARGDLPPAVDEVLGRALERDRERRYAHGAELLRALVEVSYSRTLVATALEVADVIREAFPPPRPAPPEAEREKAARLIDDIIRSELLGGATAEDGGSVSRVTARATPPSMPIVTGPEGGDGDGGPPASTGAAFVRRGAGPDGITLWELRTEERAVAAPAPAEPPPAPAPPAPAPGRRRAVVASAVAVAGLVVVAVAGELLSAGGGGAPAAPAPIVGPPPPDAAPASAELRVETTPPGATVIVDGAAWPEPTPTTVIVAPTTAAEPHVLELRLAGHRLWKDAAVVVAAGERLVYRPDLEPAGMRLDVRSRPPGAEADLDGRPLGVTPLVADDLPADGELHSLRLRKRGHADVIVRVKLDPGGDTVVDEELPQAVRYGRIKLHVEPWADVYLSGQHVGQAPVDGLRLPVGRHRLKLVNPVLKRQGWIVVDVPATGIPYYRAKLP